MDLRELPEYRLAGIAPSVELELGGKVRNLTYDLRSMVAIEKATGYDGLSGIPPRMTPSLLLAFLCGMLHSEDPTLTEDEVGSWVGVANLSDVFAAVIRAVVVGLPAVVESVAEVAPKNASRPRRGGSNG